METSTETITRKYRLAHVKVGIGDVFDCSLCDYPELEHPVFLTDGGRPFPVGTGCAAKLLGWERPERVRKEYDAMQAEAEAQADIKAERRERYTAALAAFEAAEHWDPALQSVRRTYHQLGGAQALGSFPAWIATVTETGRID